MYVNPLTPLAVGLAECKGQFALLLGSGVSVDAGTPRGGTILTISFRNFLNRRD